MKKILFQLLFVFSFLLTACASTSKEASNENGPKTPQALQPTAISGALFQVIKPDGTIVGVSIHDLNGLQLKLIAVDGKTEEGPGLLDVLHFAGVTEFTEVSLKGSSNPTTLTRDQVDDNDNTILDLTNHGTVKLATTYIPRAKWTKDVAEITVK